MLTEKTDELLEQLIYCDLRTSVGVDKAKKAIRSALRKQAASTHKTIDIEKASLEELADGLTREWLLNQAVDRAKYYWRKVDGDYSIANCDPQTKQILEYVLAAGV